MTKIIGILNFTPDSFSGDGFLQSGEVSTEQVLDRIKNMFNQGADIVDIGAESTRPNASIQTAMDEIERLQDVLPEVLREFGANNSDFPRVSLDSYHPETMEWAAGFGEFIVNDVTGMANPGMRQFVAKSGFWCIVSHLPKVVAGDIQAAHSLGDKLYDDINLVKSELLERADQMINLGVDRDKIILDPGIGFGKTMRLNGELLTFARELPDWKVLIGYSKKRFLGENRMDLEPNLAAAKVACRAGAEFIRVHDVSEHAEFLQSLRQN